MQTFRRESSFLLLCKMFFLEEIGKCFFLLHYRTHKILVQRQFFILKFK